MKELPRASRGTVYKIKSLAVEASRFILKTRPGGSPPSPLSPFPRRAEGPFFSKTRGRRMTKDIRIAFSFLNHRKRKKLEAKLGEGATKYLVDLWINTAMNHPRGRLDGMTEEDIAIDAGFQGDPHRFTSILIDAKFLDKDGETFLIHDWEEHQPFVFYSKERSQASRKAALTRWHGEEAASEPDSKAMRAASGSHTERNALFSSSSSSLPSLNSSSRDSPSPNEGGSNPKTKKEKIRVNLEWLIIELNRLMGWRRAISPGILEKVEKNLKLDPEWLEKAKKAAALVPRIDDRAWPGGKVRFEWFFQMYNPRREFDPVVDKILSGAYTMKPAPKKSYSETLEEERKNFKPASQEVVDAALKKMKEAIGGIGKIPDEKNKTKEEQIKELRDDEGKNKSNQSGD